MTKLKAGSKWLRDFGWGLTEDPEKAHDFTPDEALAICTLNRGTVPDGPSYGEPTVLDNRSQPDVSPGENMAWVRLNGAWFAADKQALFMGTREALKRATAQTSLIVEEEPA